MTATLPTGPAGPAGPPTTADDATATSTGGLGARGRQRPLWRAVLRRPAAASSVGYLVLLVVTAVAAPWISPAGPNELDLFSVMSGPTADHLLGTDPLGRDVLSRLMYGGRISLVNAAVAALVFFLAGVSGGVLAGYLGGWTDRAFTWVVDVIIAIPGLIVLLVVLTIFGGDMTFAMVALGILAAPGFARVVRSVTLAVRQEPYIAAARVSGLPTRRIVVHQVLPRISGPILVQMSLFCGGALMVDAGLSYLGFGVQPPTPTWGGMITEASTVIQQHSWLLVPPGITLGLATLAFALLGDAVRDAFAERTGHAPIRPPSRARRLQPKAVTRPAAVADGSILSLRGVGVTLPGANGPVPVVDDVDLDVRPGETVGLVGESGCGKSLTASAVLGLLPYGARVSSGTITFDGTPIDPADPRQLRAIRGSKVALISQEPIASLDPVYTAGQLVDELVRRHQGLSGKAARARTLELLESVRLRDPDQVARRYPHELSGGMAQRVAIAMALAGEPKLLIADEPTTALDVTVQDEILQLLGRLQAQNGMAVLLITHDLGVVASVCRRTSIMYAGHIVESGPTGQLLEQPRHPYTQGLLGAMPGRAKPRHHLAAIPGTVPPPGHWPAGCHFAPRCSYATAECSAGPVPLEVPDAGRLTRCLHHTELVSGGTS